MGRYHQQEANTEWARDYLIRALLDRLTHRVHILEANGESYRLREAQKRIKPLSSFSKRVKSMFRHITVEEVPQ